MVDKRHTFKKKFGQNFLSDNNYIDKIIQCLQIKDSQNIVEIGPGQGAITQHIVGACSQMILIEIDNDLINTLETKFKGYGNLTIINSDVLKVDFLELNLPKPIRVLGNLPYNISTPIMFSLFKNISIFEDLNFMLQEEVAVRLGAKPGNKDYGRLSVMAQYFCNIDILFRIPNTAFYPAPKVQSAFVRLTPITNRAVTASSIDTLSKVVTTAFSFRRKTVANALSSLISADELSSIVNIKARPEQISIDDFVRISNIIHKNVNQQT